MLDGKTQNVFSRRSQSRRGGRELYQYKVLGTHAISRMLYRTFSVVFEWWPVGDKYYTEMKVLPDTFLRGQDKLCSSNHLILLLQAYTEGLTEVCWRAWDLVFKSYSLLGEMGRGCSPFPPAKGEGLTKLVTWKKKRLPLCAWLPCAFIVLLTGPFEQVKAIDERWQGRAKCPQLHLGYREGSEVFG